MSRAIYEKWISEALAEKTRAALTRREPAIRDFFDLDFALRHFGLVLSDATFLALVAAKLAVPGNGPIDLSKARRALLAHQVESRLKPVLRPTDSGGSDLDRIFEALLELATATT